MGGDADPAGAELSDFAARAAAETGCGAEGAPSPSSGAAIAADAQHAGLWICPRSGGTDKYKHTTGAEGAGKIDVLHTKIEGETVENATLVACV
eukprot:gene18198-biopygen8389